METRGCQNRPKIYQISTQNWPKIDPTSTENRWQINPKWSQETLGAALKRQAPKKVEKGSGKVDFGRPRGTPGGPKFHRETHRKNDEKTVTSKNDIFSQIGRFSGLPASIFIDFESQNGCPDHDFSMIFWGRVFASILDDFCRKKEKTRKVKKWRIPNRVITF